MITNDWLKGYIAALDHIDSAIENMMLETGDYERDALSGYDDIRTYIYNTKINYKQLVKELNENLSKKTSS